MHAAQSSRFIYEKCFGDALDAIGLGDARADIHAIEVGDVELGKISDCLFLCIHPIHADERHALVFIFAPRSLKVRCLLATRLTPRCPKINNDHLPAQLTERDRLTIKS